MTEPFNRRLPRHCTRLPLQKLRLLTTMQAKGKGKQKDVSESLLPYP